MNTMPRQRNAKEMAWVAAKWLFSCAALLFLIRYAIGIHRSGSGQAWGNPAIAAGVCGAAIPFALAVLLTSQAWRRLLASASHRVSFRAAFGIVSRTQIAKYIPGNIGHHVGRVALARADLGVPSPTAIATLLQESLIAVVASTGLGIVLYAAANPTSTLPVPGGQGLTLAFMAPVFIAVLAAGFILLQYLRDRITGNTPQWQAWLRRLLPPRGASAQAIAYFAGVSLLNCIAVAVLACITMQLDAPDMTAICGAYLLSWSVGFLLPGAPGGLGVREAAFILLLDGRFPPSQLLALTVAARAASILADCLVFLAGLALARRD